MNVFTCINMSYWQCTLICRTVFISQDKEIQTITDTSQNASVRQIWIDVLLILILNETCLLIYTISLFDLKWIMLLYVDNGHECIDYKEFMVGKKIVYNYHNGWNNLDYLRLISRYSQVVVVFLCQGEKRIQVDFCMDNLEESMDHSPHTTLDPCVPDVNSLYGSLVSIMLTVGIIEEIV